MILHKLVACGKSYTGFDNGKCKVTFESCSQLNILELYPPLNPALKTYIMGMIFRNNTRARHNYYTG
jgi:hypothetical protein